MLKTKIIVVAGATILALAVFSYFNSYNTTLKTNQTTSMATQGLNQTIMQVSSPAFKNDTNIPSEFTCDGLDISPPIDITGVPKEAKTLSIIMQDPDAPMGTITHWLVWNVPPTKLQFIKNEKIEFAQGLTSLGKIGYGGPCPPSGIHRYFFKIYALDSKLDLVNGSSVTDLQKAMLGHVVAEDTLMGKYAKK